MSDARTNILARLRNAQQTARLPVVNMTNSARRSLDPATRNLEACLERFRNELTTIGVEHHLEPSAGGVRQRVAELVAGRSVLSWDAELLPYEVGSLLRDPRFGRSPREEQAKADIGLTGCDAAIAETGSLVLLSGKGKSRAVSLLPPVHLAVVRPEDLCFSMGEFFRSHSDRIAGAACCTFITGPSRTADIELTLTLGVHGPGKVIVVIGP